MENQMSQSKKDKNLEVRAAKISEIEWINQRYDEVEFVRSVFEKEIIAIAEVDGQKAGIGRLVNVNKGNLELGGMYVFESFRGKGIAGEIIEFLLSHADSKSIVYCIPFQHLVPFYEYNEISGWRKQKR
jgi:GNAT superfamily N-acetyltransferase